MSFVGFGCGGFCGFFFFFPSGGDGGPGGGWQWVIGCGIFFFFFGGGNGGGWQWVASCGFLFMVVDCGMTVVAVEVVVVVGLDFVMVVYHYFNELLILF